MVTFRVWIVSASSCRTRGGRSGFSSASSTLSRISPTTLQETSTAWVLLQSRRSAAASIVSFRCALSPSVRIRIFDSYTRPRLTEGIWLTGTPFRGESRVPLKTSVGSVVWERDRARIYTRPRVRSCAYPGERTFGRMNPSCPTINTG
jgi:hypothetical protein